MRSAEPRGFTLVEVVVVLCILAVSAAVVVPAFAGAGRRDGAAELTDAAVSLLERARRLAIARASAVEATVDVRRGRAQLAVVNEDSTHVVLDTLLTPVAGVSLAARAPLARWTFHLDGSANGDTLRIEGRTPVLVTVDPITGMVRRDAR